MSISHGQESNTDARQKSMNINFRLSRSFIDTSHCGKTKPVQRLHFLSQESNCNLADHAGADRKNRPGNRSLKSSI